MTLSLAICMAPFSHAVTQTTSSTHIDTVICNGGMTAPSFVNVAPPSATTVVTPTLTIVATVNWGLELTATRGSNTLGSTALSYIPNETTSLTIPLQKGNNTLVLTLQGGCPETTVIDTLTINYDPDTSTVTSQHTSTRSPQLRGTVAHASSRVFIVVDGHTYEAHNNGDGTWTLLAGIITPDLIDGTYAIRVYTTDPSGSTTLSDETFPGALTIDTIAPTGSMTTTQSTSRSPELHGTVSDSVTTIVVEINGHTYEAHNNGDGTWTLPEDTISPLLASGTYQVTITFTDPAGNMSTSFQTVVIEAPNEIGFILTPNTGYLRLGAASIPSWTLYLALIILLIALCYHFRRPVRSS